MRQYNTYASTNLQFQFERISKTRLLSLWATAPKKTRQGCAVRIPLVRRNVGIRTIKTRSLSFPNSSVGNPGPSSPIAHGRCNSRSGSPLKACGDDKISHFAANAGNDLRGFFGSHLVHLIFPDHEDQCRVRTRFEPSTSAILRPSTCLSALSSPGFPAQTRTPQHTLPARSDFRRASCCNIQGDL